MRRVILLLLFPLCGALMAGTTSFAASTPPIVLPTVSGSFNEAPTITFPSKVAPSILEAKVLHEGSGALVSKGSLIAVNYLGQIWGGKVFDSSFARSEPTGFPIGIGQVIPGWDKVLVGKRVGSRVVMVLPPVDGYGTAGNSQAGIKGTDTLTFVVDILGTYTEKTGVNAPAKTLTNSGDGVSVSGASGSAPTVTVAKNAPKPTKTITVLLARGSGAKVTPGLVVLQIVAIDWTGKVIDSTYRVGYPDNEALGDASNPNTLDSLIGLPLGSRALVLIPKNSNGGPYALDVDVVAEPHGTASQLK